MISAKPLDDVRYRDPNADQMIEITLKIPRRDMARLDAFMQGDAWEKVQAARDAKLSECTKSIAVLLNTALQHKGTSGGRVCATVLASLYNGDRVKFDVSDLKRLDPELFEHAMNTIRLCVDTCTEPHQFFKGGGAIFERMIADWGLETKRRARS